MLWILTSWHYSNSDRIIFEYCHSYANAACSYLHSKWNELYSLNFFFTIFWSSYNEYEIIYHSMDFNDYSVFIFFPLQWIVFWKKNENTKCLVTYSAIRMKVNNGIFFIYIHYILLFAFILQFSNVWNVFFFI